MACEKVDRKHKKTIYKLIKYLEVILIHVNCLNH